MVYVQWMQDVAESHIETLGFGTGRIYTTNMRWSRLSIMCSIVRLRLRERLFCGHGWMIFNALYSSHSTHLSSKDQISCLLATPNGPVLKCHPGRPRNACHRHFIHAYQPIPVDLNPMDFFGFLCCYGIQIMREA